MFSLLAFEDGSYQLTVRTRRGRNYGGWRWIYYDLLCRQRWRVLCQDGI